MYYVLGGYDMSDTKSSILEQWERIKVIVDSTEVDLLKNANGNASAGVRARKGLRLLKTEAHELVKLTVAEAKRAREAA